MRFSVLINFLLLPVILIILLFAFLATRPTLEQEVAFPESVYRFIFDTREQEELFIQSLQSQGFTGVLGPSTLQITLTDTFRPRIVPFQRLTELIPEDPRRTAYITLLEEMFLGDNQPRVFVPPQPGRTAGTEEMIDMFGLVTNQELSLPEPRPWLEILLVGVLCLFLGILWSPSIVGAWITKTLSLIFLLVLIREPGPRLFLLPALIGILGSFFAFLEQTIAKVTRKPVWFRFKHLDLVTLLWIVLFDSWKSLIGTTRIFKKPVILLALGFMVIPLLVLSLLLDPQILLVIFGYSLILTLALISYGLVLSLRVSRRLHPYFDFFHLYTPVSRGPGWRLLLSVVIVIFYGTLGYVSVEYQAIQLQAYEIQELQNQALIHNFYQEWFGFGIELSDVQDGLHIMIDRFTQDSQGFVYSRDSVIQFTDWVKNWVPHDYEPSSLLRFLESGTDLWVVSIPDLGIYSRRTGVFELIIWGIFMALISILTREVLLKRIARLGY